LMCKMVDRDSVETPPVVQPAGVAGHRE
jgi:hypothetical protein